MTRTTAIVESSPARANPISARVWFANQPAFDQVHQSRPSMTSACSTPTPVDVWTMIPLTWVNA